MPLSYRQASAPAVEPVTLAMAKQQLVLDPTYTADDTLVKAYITAARQHCEKLMQRAIYNRTMLLGLDFFPLASDSPADASAYGYVTSYIRSLSIRPPFPGLVSVQSIQYMATANPNALTTLPASAYYVDALSEPGRIMPAPGTFWPYQDQYLPGQIQVAYTSGTFGDGLQVDTCPQAIKLAVLLLVGHFYAHREATTEATLSTIPLGVDSLLAPYCFETVY